jgi:hypothetical protein
LTVEAQEAQELHEHAEHAAHDSAMRPVAFTISVLAVLVAIVTVLGHRAHTDAVLNQNRATDQWNLYQAHKIRANDTELIADLLSVVAVAHADTAAEISKSYADHQARWATEDKEAQHQAEDLEAQVEQAERRGGRFDLAEVLLEIALVITSVTLLTRARIYWYFGLAFSVAGIIAAVSAFLLR